MTSDDSSTAFPKWSKLLYTDAGTHPPLYGKTSAHSYLQHYRKMVSCLNIPKCERKVNEKVLEHFV